MGGSSIHCGKRSLVACVLPVASAEWAVRVTHFLKGLGPRYVLGCTTVAVPVVWGVLPVFGLPVHAKARLVNVLERIKFSI